MRRSTLESREGVEPSHAVLQTAILAGESARSLKRKSGRRFLMGRRHVRVGGRGCAERAEGVAPSLSVWKTAVLLLDDARELLACVRYLIVPFDFLWE